LLILGILACPIRSEERPKIIDRRLQAQVLYGLAVGALAEYMVVSDKPLIGGVTYYKPTFGAYAILSRVMDPFQDSEEPTMGGGGFSTYYWIPLEGGRRNVFYSGGRFGLAFPVSGENPSGSSDFINRMQISAVAGLDFEIGKSLHPQLEFVFGAPGYLSLRAGLSWQLANGGAPPSKNESAAPDGPAFQAPAKAGERGEMEGLLKAPPRFRAQGGALFSNSSFGLPVTGGKWYGGGLEAGMTLVRLTRTRELGASACGEWNAAEPLRAFSGGGDKFIATGFRLYHQNLERYADGIGARFNVGMDYVFKRTWGIARWESVPTFSVTLIAQTRSGPYLFLDMGGVLYAPLTLGVGTDI
jgi:hypothetical protein